MNRNFAAEREELLGKPELQGAGLCRAYSDLVDDWLRSLFRGEPGLALVAVGGYGREELCPCSDIDVLLVHGGRRGVAAIAEAVWYPLWDAGVKLGHGVRTIKEAISLAGADLEVATSLLSVRLVAGDRALASDLAARALGQWRKRSSRWLTLLGEAVTARHARAGEVAFLLEPDLKEGRGGLRDVHALRWAEAAERILLPGDDEALQNAYDGLLAVRAEVHRRTGKASDRLLLQDQDAIAHALGYRDADELMGRVAGAARTIAWTSDEAWWRIESSLRGPKGRAAGGDQPLGPGVVLRDGVVELTADADLVGDPALVLRAAAAAAEAEARLGRAALDRLSAASFDPNQPWPSHARQALVALLATGGPAIAVLEALDQRGLLVRLMPEWNAVRHLPQRNAYHRFTVDRHLCEAAAEAAKLAGRVRRPDLLLVAAWLHDIGKGLGGDHAESGAEAVARISLRMGFEAQDVDVLVRLVRHHLLLADTATRRDLADPATTRAVADAVRDCEVLALLHALTEADSIATGPWAWSSWKAALVDDLVTRTARLLSGGPLEEPTKEPLSPRQEAAVQRAGAQRQPALDVDGSVLTVVAPDRPGLFARVAGTLTLHGLDILSARSWSTEDGLGVQVIEVVPTFGRAPDWPAFEADLTRALSGRLSLEARLADQQRSYAMRRRPLAAAPARTEVSVDNQASALASVLEVRAPDHLGTLYRITRALADLDLDIRHAKVATFGHEVIDAFYVVGADGAKLDAEHAREAERAVLVELSRV